MRLVPCEHCGQALVFEFGKLDGYDYQRGIVSRHTCPSPDMGRPPNEREFCQTCNGLKAFCDCQQPKLTRPRSPGVAPVAKRAIPNPGAAGPRGGVS